MPPTDVESKMPKSHYFDRILAPSSLTIIVIPLCFDHFLSAKTSGKECFFCPLFFAKSLMTSSSLGKKQKNLLEEGLKMMGSYFLKDICQNSFFFFAFYCHGYVTACILNFGEFHLDEVFS